jgi:hypothetical protein
MNITREQHVSYLAKISPLIGITYLIQAQLYLHYLPSELTREIVASIGLCLIFLILGFLAHDRFHKISLHTNHREIKFAPLKLHRELLYRNIQSVKVKKEGKAFSDVIIELKDGEIIKLHHIDNPTEVQRILCDYRTR